MATRKKKKTSESGIIEWITGLNAAAQLFLAVVAIAGVIGVGTIYFKPNPPHQPTLGEGKVGRQDNAELGKGKLGR
jgi:hypothetical protein